MIDLKFKPPLKDHPKDGHCFNVSGAALSDGSFFGYSDMDIEKGYVKVYRKIADNPGYFSETFCRNMAWIDLIMLANWRDGYFRVRGVRVDVKRGTIGYGIETLAGRWKWSRGKVERFLSELENDKQIVRQKSNVTTLISICNYDQYQSDGKANDNANDKPNDKASDKANGQQTVKQTDINNKNKNDNNVKKVNKYKEENVKEEKSFTAPTIEEVKKYFYENGYSIDAGQKAFNYYDAANWKDSKGSKVRNWKQKMIAVWFKPENRAVKEPYKGVLA